MNLSSVSTDDTQQIPKEKKICDKYDKYDNVSVVETKEPPYSVYNEREKLLIAFVCGISGFWSAISANIYYPILVIMQQKFNVSEEMSNIAVVLYFIFQGITPMFTATIADSIGRKPVVLFCCALYIIACACIGVSDAYWLILVLRCIQSAGISPVVAINSGVCADLATKAHRGSLIGFTAGIQLIATGIGSLLGGVLVSGFNSWRAIFWFLAIGCGVSMIASLFILPETKRTIVGNGSIPPKNFINKSPLFLIPHFKKKLTCDMSTLEQTKPQSMISKMFDVPVIMTRPEVFMTLIPSGLFFLSWSMMLTTLSTQLQIRKGYSILHVGICFLAPGVAASLGAICSGRIIDWYFKSYNAELKRRIEQWKNLENASGIRKPRYDVFRCRLPILFPMAFACCIGYLIFGWCMDTNQPLAPILIGSFIGTLCNSGFISVATNLMADLFPEKTSTSTACVNLTRCLLSAVGIAVLSRMENSMTVGGTYTFLSAICGLGMVSLWVVMKKGTAWIDQREASGCKEDDTL